MASCVFFTLPHLLLDLVQLLRKNITDTGSERVGALVLGTAGIAHSRGRLEVL